MDARGQALPQAHAAYVTQTGEYHPLEVDEKGRAALPVDLADVALLGHAENRSAPQSVWNPGPLPADSTLVLPDWIELTGTLNAQGLPTDASTQIWRVSHQDHLRAVDATAASQSVRARIIRDGFSERDSWVQTDSIGGFLFPRVHPENSASLYLPGSFLSMNEVLAPGTRQASIAAYRVPYVRARILWADTREPVLGSLSLGLVEGLTGELRSRSVRANPEGIVELGLDVTPTERATAGSRFIQLRLTCKAQGATEQSFELDLEGTSLPFDWGDLLMRRSESRRTVIVRGPDGKPVADAWVSQDRQQAATDASGRAVLPGLGPGPLFVSAPGFQVARVPSGELPVDDKPIEVHLERGTRLLIRASLGPGDAAADTPLALRMTYRATDIERLYGAPLESGWPSPVVLQRLPWVLSDDFLPGGSYQAKVEWRQDALLVSPVPPGVLDLTLCDFLGSPLAAQSVTVPEDADEVRVELKAPPASTGRVRLTGGILEQFPIPSLDAGLRRLDVPAERSFPITHPFLLGPLAPGRYSIVLGLPGLPTVMREFDLHPGEQEWELPVGGGRMVYCTWPAEQRAPEVLLAHFPDGTVRAPELLTEDSATIHGLPEGAFQLEAQFGLERWTTQVTADQQRKSSCLKAEVRCRGALNQRPQSVGPGPTRLLLLFGVTSTAQDGPASCGEPSSLAPGGNDPCLVEYTKNAAQSLQISYPLQPGPVRLRVYLYERRAARPRQEADVVYWQGTPCGFRWIRGSARLRLYRGPAGALAAREGLPHPIPAPGSPGPQGET
ncbi:MAG: carboxypeptidase-like regulatory domain-containing protein [Planctomycetota bacterium]